MKGILLAGGTGSRLYPMTLAVSKQLLPLYDKPMIYYPLSVLMLADIREILLITTPQDMPLYKRLLGDGTEFGIQLEYIEQEQPRGLAEAFLLGEKFIGQSSVCLVLGDNVFYGMSLSNLLARAKSMAQGGCIFAYPVSNPKEFGVVTFDSSGRAISVEEKPEHPKSNYAVPGIYFYDNSVVSVAQGISPSPRGELEISAVNTEYLSRGTLSVINMGRGMAWLDTGTPSGMMKAAQFVEAVQGTQGLYIACLEEIALHKQWISVEQLHLAAQKMQHTDYGRYLNSLSDVLP